LFFLGGTLRRRKKAGEEGADGPKSETAKVVKKKRFLESNYGFKINLTDSCQNGLRFSKT
jgi:hypothetical protein